jgi:hypothetical protein
MRCHTEEMANWLNCWKFGQNAQSSGSATIPEKRKSEPIVSIVDAQFPWYCTAPRQDISIDILIMGDNSTEYWARGGLSNDQSARRKSNPIRSVILNSMDAHPNWDQPIDHLNQLGIPFLRCNFKHVRENCHRKFIWSIELTLSLRFMWSKMSWRTEIRSPMPLPISLKLSQFLTLTGRFDILLLTTGMLHVMDNSLIIGGGLRASSTRYCCFSGRTYSNRSQKMHIWRKIVQDEPVEARISALLNTISDLVEGTAMPSWQTFYDSLNW